MNGLRVQSYSNTIRFQHRQSPRQICDKQSLELEDYQCTLNATTTGFMLGKYNSQIKFIDNDQPVKPPVNSGMNTAQSKQSGNISKKQHKKRSITGPLIKLDPIKVQNIVSKKKSQHIGQTQWKNMQFGSLSSIGHTSSMHIMPEFSRDTKTNLQFRVPKSKFKMNSKLPVQNP